MKFLIAAIFVFTSAGHSAQLTQISEYIDNSHLAIELLDLPDQGLSAYSIKMLIGGLDSVRLKSFERVFDLTSAEINHGSPFLGANNELYILDSFWRGEFRYLDVAQNQIMSFQSQFDKSRSDSIVSKDLKSILFLGKRDKVYLYSSTKNNFLEFGHDGDEMTNYLSSNFDFVADASGGQHVLLLSDANAHYGMRFSLNIMNAESGVVTFIRHPDYNPSSATRPTKEFKSVKAAFLPTDNTLLALVGSNEADKVFFVRGETNTTLDVFNVDSSSVVKFSANTIIGMQAFNDKAYAVIMGSGDDAIYQHSGDVLLHFVEITKNGPKLIKTVAVAGFTRGDILYNLKGFTHVFSDSKAPLLTLRNSSDEQMFFDMRDGQVVHTQPMGNKVIVDLKVRGSDIYIMSHEVIGSDKHVTLEKLNL